MGLFRKRVTAAPGPAPIVYVQTTVMPDRGAPTRWIDNTTRQGQYPEFLGWDNTHQIQLANGVSKLARRKDQYQLGPLNASVPGTPTITNPNNPQPATTWNTTGNAPKSLGSSLIPQNIKSSGNTSGSGPGTVIYTGATSGVM